MLCSYSSNTNFNGVMTEYPSVVGGAGCNHGGPLIVWSEGKGGSQSDCPSS